MKFTICHDTSKKTLAIPRAALQLSGLANAERLSLHTGRGCIVLTRQVPTIRERLESIRLLHDLNVGMVCRLALDSRTASGMPCKRASDAINTMAKEPFPFHYKAGPGGADPPGSSGETGKVPGEWGV